jgi:hypothetical protein
VASKQEDKQREPLSDEERTPAEEMTTLGQCRYCENDAVRMALHKDGTGWVGICDEHEKRARDDDFKPEKEKHSSVS